MRTKLIVQKKTSKKSKIVQQDYKLFTQNEEQTEMSVTWTFSPNDFREVIEASRTLKFNQNDTILKEGSDPGRCLFMIDSGSCHVLERGKVVKILKKNAIFSVENLMCPVCSEVIAVEDNTKVSCVEGYYLDVLFSYNPSLSARFYLYLATKLSRKIETILLSKSLTVPNDNRIIQDIHTMDHSSSSEKENNPMLADLNELNGQTTVQEPSPGNKPFPDKDNH